MEEGRPLYPDSGSSHDRDLIVADLRTLVASDVGVGVLSWGNKAWDLRSAAKLDYQLRRRLTIVLVVSEPTRRRDRVADPSLIGSALGTVRKIER